MDKKLQVLVLSIIFLSALALWSVPFQKNQMPFGDVDSSNHFTIGDYMYTEDKVIFDLPFYLSQLFGERLAYPPQGHTFAGISQFFSGNRIIGAYLYFALVSCLSILGAYLIFREAFGWQTALLSSFLLIFSTRDLLLYILGMWPQAFSFAFVPLVLYSYYKYFHSKKKAYLALAGLTLALQYTIHPQALFFTSFILVVYTGIQLIKKRKWIEDGKKVVYVGIIAMLLILMFAPFQIKHTLQRLGVVEAPESDTANIGIKDLSRLFQWYSTENPGVPADWISYKGTYREYWTLPFLLIGLFYIFYRRKDADLMLISWLVGLYVFMHLDVIGIARASRFLGSEPHLFFGLIAAGAIIAVKFIVQLVKSISIADDRHKKIIGAATAAVLIIAFISAALAINGKYTYAQLENTYPNIMRATPVQYAAYEWIDDNLDDEAYLRLIGGISNFKNKWVRGISHREVTYDDSLFAVDVPDLDRVTHVLIDYSDWYALGREDAIGAIQKWENENMGNNTIIYDDQGMIKVYEIEDR